MPTIAVVGSGMAGLSAAKALTTHPHGNGLTVLVLDKGRYAGGRMASQINTAPADGGWDYGTQYAKAHTNAFYHWVTQQVSQVTPWPDPDRFIIPGGFRQLAERAAIGLNLSQRTTIASIGWDHASQRWQIQGNHETAGAKTWWADGLLLTCPVPQALALIERFLPADHGLHAVTYAPNLTLQLNADRPLPTPYRSEQGIVGWVCDNQPKWPEATHHWTVQSTADFAQTHFDHTDDDITRQMLDALTTVIDVPYNALTVHRLKRWRYALVSQPYALPYYAHPQLPVWVAGDGFAGPRLEGAWQSGQHVAKAMLAAYLDPLRH